MKIDYNDSVNMNCLMQTMYFLVEEVEHWILRHDEPSDYNWDSFAQAIEVGAWAQEFEEAWRTPGMEDELNVDYPYMICAYAERKCKAYFGDWPESKQEPKPVSVKASQTERKFEVSTPMGRLEVSTKHEDGYDDPDDFPGVYVTLKREDKPDELLAVTEYHSLRGTLDTCVYQPDIAEHPEHITIHRI